MIFFNDININMNSLISNKQWTLIYFVNDNLDEYIKYELFRLSIISFTIVLNFVKIKIYINQTNDIINNISKEFKCKIVSNVNYNKLHIINKYINNKKNIILSKPNIICKINNIIDITNIYAYYTSINKHMYPQIMELNEIIDTDFIIINYDENLKLFMNDIYTLEKQINIIDNKIICNLLFTLTNKKYNIIKNINDTIFSEMFIDQKIDKNFINTISELKKDDQNIDWKSWLHKKNLNRILHDMNEYIYYPMLDVYYNCKYNDNINESFGFNTNFYYIDIKSQPEIRKLMFKRFNSKYEGFYIRKNKCLEIIPNNFHHLLLFENDINNEYIILWKNILKDWSYNIWTINDLRLKVFKPDGNGLNRWEKLYDMEKNITIKIFIASIAILERFGGIILDGYAIPIKKIYSEILHNRFFIGFLDEKKGINISFRFMGAIKHISLFDDIYELICNNQIIHINDFILGHTDVTTIYPSYFFNSTHDNLPYFLKNKTICIIIWKKEEENIKQNNKQIIQKNVKKNIASDMILKLKTNPINNIKKLN